MLEDVTIAIVAPVEPEDFFDLLWQGVWEATFDLASFGVQVRNLTTERMEIDGQRRLLDGLLEDGVKGIAIVPAHARALDDLIAQHEDRGTRVVTFHGDAPGSRRSAFVGANPFDAGGLAGEVLAKLMGGKGRVLSFPGPGDEHHFAQRYSGFRAEMARQAGISEAASNIALDGGGDELLSALESASGFYAGNEDLAKLAAALEGAKLKKPCIGFSNTASVRRFLERQTVSAVIDETRYREGYFAVQKVYEAVLQSENGGELCGIQIPSNVVFASNASEMCDSLNNAFETLVRQRTEILTSYKARLQQANAELLNLATTDPLTGLLNRRKFEEAIQQEVARALRYGPAALLLIDVNLFKLINDRYGHPAGDEALKTVAEVLKSSSRTTDICARLGGDEFAVILPHTDGKSAAVVRDRIMHAIEQARVPNGDSPIPLSLSIGIASAPEDAGNADKLVAAADAAMYQAKEASRDRSGPPVR